MIKETLLVIVGIGVCGPFWIALAWILHWRKELPHRRKQKRIWESELEPQWRTYAGYPPDWERRRAIVYVRDRGICQKCRMKCGKMSGWLFSVWGMNLRTKIVTGAHVHHVRHRSNGGDHGIENLQLLCESCHAREHPENRDFAAKVAARIAAREELKRILNPPPSPPPDDVPF